MNHRVLRGSVTVADSAISSGSNFALGILVARAVSQESYGRFGLVFTLYSLGVALWRAGASEPFLLSDRRRENAVAAASISASGLVGLAACALSIPVALVVGGELRLYLLAFAVSLPVIALQDGYRYGAIARERPSVALAMDSIWLAALVIAGFATSSGPVLVIAWGASGLVSALFGHAMLQLSIPPGASRGATWLRENRELGWRFSIEALLTAAVPTVVILALGFVDGPAAMAVFRGASLLLGPVSVFAAGLLTVALSGGREGSRDGVVRLTGLLSVAVCLVSAGAAAGIGLVPLAAGSAILGESWGASQDNVPLLAATIAGLTVLSLATTGCRLLGRSDRGFRVRSVSMVLIAIAGSIGSIVGSVDGALTALASVTAVCAVAARLTLLAINTAGAEVGSPLTARAEGDLPNRPRRDAEIEPDRLMS